MRPTPSERIVQVVLAAGLLIATGCLLAGCDTPPSADDLRPIDSLSVRVEVVSPTAIHTALLAVGSPAAARGIAFFDAGTCTVYLPAGVPHAEFQRLLAHEFDHALGREHDDAEHWQPIDPGRAAALQSRCVRTAALPDSAR